MQRGMLSIMTTMVKWPIGSAPRRCSRRQQPAQPHRPDGDELRAAGLQRSEPDVRELRRRRRRGGCGGSAARMVTVSTVRRVFGSSVYRSLVWQPNWVRRGAHGPRHGPGAVLRACAPRPRRRRSGRGHGPRRERRAQGRRQGHRQVRARRPHCTHRRLDWGGESAYQRGRAHQGGTSIGQACPRAARDGDVPAVARWHRGPKCGCGGNCRGNSPKLRLGVDAWQTRISPGAAARTNMPDWEWERCGNWC